MSDELTLDEIARLEPKFYGPTWATDGDGDFLLPEHTLGWEIAGWCLEYLEDEQGRPWRFTNEQVRFLCWWYALNDRGEFVHRRGVLQRMKGWGKDPLLAVLCLVELCGPSRFSHWADDGSPVGMRHPSPWVQVAAVARDQTMNTTKCFAYLMSDRFRTTYEIDAGQEYIRAMGGRCTLQILTSNFRKLEGSRSTFILLNETHHWVSNNGGIKMFETIDGNATKGSNRYISITNAYLPGEDSVAERQRASYEDILEGRSPDVGFLYDTIEADPQTPLTPDALRIVLPKIRGDAVWLNVEDIIASVMQTSISPARSRRMWLNQVFADADGLYQPKDWDCLSDGHEGEELERGDKIVLGFDGGRSDDATALIAIRVSDGFIQPLLIEERPATFERDQHWEVDRQRVHSAVHAAHAKYQVEAFYGDVLLWEDALSEWAQDYGPTYKVKATDRHAIAWDMRGATRRVTFAHEFLMRMVFAKNLHHAGHATPLGRALRRHVFNARRAENKVGVSFSKESRESPKKVDAYAALMIATAALDDVRRKPAKEAPGQGAWFL